MMQVIGARGTIHDIDMLLQQIRTFAEKKCVTIQAVNADVVFGKKHLISAVHHAIRAFQQKTQATNSLAMEILLYASGERQIKRALRKMGIQKGKGNIALVIISNMSDLPEAQGRLSNRDITGLLKKMKLTRDDTVLVGNKAKLRHFGITDAELATVVKAKYGHLILEKVAFVDIIK